MSLIALIVPDPVGRVEVLVRFGAQLHDVDAR
jgi:hypothetical protein